MKKITITFLTLCSSVLVLGAQTATTTEVRKPLTPAVVETMKDMKGKVMAPGQMMTTGDKALDAEIKALNKEMEEKIKAIRDEYMTKIKALTEGKRPVVVKPNGATSTVKEFRKEVKDVRKEMMQQASSTPPQKPQGMMQRLFGR